MKILVIGGGGREHALCWRLGRDGHVVSALPGSTGIASIATCVPGSLSELTAIVGCAKELAVDLVVVGPEVPLAEGLADQLRAAGIAVFGPSAEAAQLEGSKSYSKKFFARHGIRSARFYECQSREEIVEAVAQLGERMVVKADGLAAGKGVVVCSSADEARAAGMEMFEEGRFGSAGQTVVIEDRLEGRELSVMAICDGKRYEVLAQAEDHKAIFDGDKGPNTGGMGTVSPPSWASDALLDRVRSEILDPTVAGLVAEGLDFRGVLYAGIMVDAEGNPWLLEYNVRFGDPETQPVMVRMKSDLGEWLAGAANGSLPEGHIEWDSRAAVCVVLASAGYPESSSKGDSIEGVEEAEASADTVVFHAGCALGETGLETAGGRVLGVTALGSNAAAAAAAAYQAVASISFEGMQFRKDIGARGE
ncbi:MAG: phosphoribosylamine--glycine ligase [Myxococcales bacterium]|nr:phosphoribosylamine--glycine ligase [Myxococcales bacterium]